MRQVLALTLDPELSADLRRVAHEQGYRSPEDVICEALADWKIKRADPAVALASLKAALQLGLDDITAGRVVDFNVEDIVARARERLAKLKGAAPSSPAHPGEGRDPVPPAIQRSAS